MQASFVHTQGAVLVVRFEHVMTILANVLSNHNGIFATNGCPSASTWLCRCTTPPGRIGIL